jgi:uncharacterized protein (TIGR02466 family)
MSDIETVEVPTTEIIGECSIPELTPEQQANRLNVEYHFPSDVYWIDKPEFLDTAKLVSMEYLKQAKKNKPKDKLMDKLYPVVMSRPFVDDERVRDLVSYIAQTSWNILAEQGHDMRYQEVSIMDFWAQEHHMRSANEEHVHGFGAQITGFYILEAPENCSNISVHDPRPAKRQINLPESDMSRISYASNAAYYMPKAGMLYFMNTWIPHGFTRHASDKPLKFIHFNLASRWIPQPMPDENTEAQPAVEII